MSHPLRVLVCGDRRWKSYDIMLRELSCLPSDATVLHGGCIGAVTIAGSIATQLGLDIEIYPANWKRYGKAAGPIRNSKMLNLNIDFVVAFHTNIKISRGTIDTIRKARRLGIPYTIIST